MFVHLDTKTGDDCVSIAVTPKMTARELQRRAIKKAKAANYTGDSSRFVLHEVRAFSAALHCSFLPAGVAKTCLSIICMTKSATICSRANALKTLHISSIR